MKKIIMVIGVLMLLACSNEKKSETSVEKPLEKSPALVDSSSLQPPLKKEVLNVSSEEELLKKGCIKDGWEYKCPEGVLPKSNRRPELSKSERIAISKECTPFAEENCPPNDSSCFFIKYKECCARRMLLK